MLDTVKGFFDFVLTSLKNMVKAEPARFIGYGSAVAVAAVLWITSQVGFTFSPEFLAAVGIFGAAVAGEIIRRFVFAPDTTQAIADRAAATGNTDIGSPPKGAVG